MFSAKPAKAVAMAAPLAPKKPAKPPPLAVEALVAGLHAACGAIAWFAAERDTGPWAETPEPPDDSDDDDENVHAALSSTARAERLQARAEYARLSAEEQTKHSNTHHDRKTISGMCTSHMVN